MNPNTAQTLDPKLKEAYDRVMGAELPKATSSPASASGQAWKPPAQPAAAPTPQPATQADSQVEMVNINTPTSQGQMSTVVSAKKSKTKPIIFVAAGILFFAVYTVIWLKFFSVIQPAEAVLKLLEELVVELFLHFFF